MVLPTPHHDGSPAVKQILVIDDDEVPRRAIRMGLERVGFRTLEAESGAEGVQLAQERSPDLIICDVFMPGVDGYAALEQLRNHPQTATIPVILMTGYSDMIGMRRGMSLGADDYLSKPFTIPELLAAINTRLEKRDALRENAEQKLAGLRSSISLSLPHELLTPLNGIMGLADFLRADPGSMPPAEIKEMAEDIYQCSGRLHRIIKNYLIYAQIEMLAADPLKTRALRAHITPSCALILETKSRARAEEAARGADLVLRLSDGHAAISKDYLLQIAEELLDNAFKFSPRGTPVEVTSARSDEEFLFSIGDHGRGMSLEQIKDVGAYSQFDRRFTAHEGIGLGLTIAKRLVELHEGRLSIESEMGRGTTVTVRLPAGRFS